MPPARDENLVFRRIGDETILVPIRQGSPDATILYVLNDTAARIWTLMDGLRDVRAIAEEITREFEVSIEEAEADVRSFLAAIESIRTAEGAAA